MNLSYPRRQPTPVRFTSTWPPPGVELATVGVAVAVTLAGELCQEVQDCCWGSGRTRPSGQASRGGAAWSEN
ncbi:MAG: hypothetical protein U0401_21850 [Anaerolineae bacterium]